MALDLEIAGAVRELGPDDMTPASAPRPLVRLRDSHHQVARLIARGLVPQEVSRMTGYAISRLSYLQNQDPSFQELVEFYRRDNKEEQQEIEQRFLGVMKDALQTFHERILDNPETMSDATLLEGFKVLADRSGYAPVTRSVNKNLNLNIGAKYDRAVEKA